MPNQDPHIILKSFVGPASYLTGVAAAWINVKVAFVVYLLTPLFFIVPPPSRRVEEAVAESDPRPAL
jgi:hypothetical protein